MSTAQVESELIALLAANLPSGYSSANIEYPAAKLRTTNNGKWIRPSIIFTTTDNIAASGSASRTYGFFVVDIFHPYGTGSQSILNEADALKLAFHNQATLIVKLQETQTNIIGHEFATGLYHVQLQTRFFYED